MLDRRTMLASSRRGGIMKGCLIVLLILVVIGIGVGIFVAMNARDWSASAMSAVTKEVINESDLPPAEKPEIVAVFDDLFDGFRNKQVTLEELGEVVEGLEDAPAFWIGMLMQFEGGFERTTLSAEEKEAGRLALNRVAQGVDSGALTVADAKAVLDTATVPDADDPTDEELQMPEDLTPEQLAQVVAAAQAKADEAGVPNERVEIDLSEEFREYIEETLGRSLGTAAPEETGG